MRFNGKFHGQLLQHVFGKAIDDQCHGLFLAQPALHGVEQLIVRDFGRCRFMLNLGRGVFHFNIGHRVRAALIAQQQAVALREIAHAFCLWGHAYQPAIGAIGMARANPLGHNG